MPMITTASGLVRGSSGISTWSRKARNSVVSVAGHGRDHALPGERPEHGQPLPSAGGSRTIGSLPLAGVEPDHVGQHAALVDKYQPVRIKRAHFAPEPGAFGLNVGTLALRGA